MYYRAKLSSSSDKVKYVQLTVPEELREEKLEYTGAATIVGKKIIIKKYIYLYYCIVPTICQLPFSSFHLRKQNGIAVCDWRSNLIHGSLHGDQNKDTKAHTSVSHNHLAYFSVLQYWEHYATQH